MAVIVPPDPPRREAPSEQRTRPEDIEALIAEARRRTRRRRARYAFALATLVLIAVGLYSLIDRVGATSPGRDSRLAASSAFGSCPRQVHVIWRVNMAHGPQGTVVPPDPLAGQLCVYTSDRGAPTPLRFSALLSRTGARALALLLDRRGGPGPSCDYGHPALLRLSYQSGRVISRLAQGCDPELVWTPGGRRALSPSGTLAVGGLIDPPLTRGGRVSRVHDYLGRAVAVAGRDFRRDFKPPQGLSLDELSGSGAPFGRVVWQTPLPGSAQAGGSAGANVIVAVHPEPLCRANQLRGRYFNGQPVMAGLHLGSIELIDISPRPCSLRGRIALHGTARNGGADTETYVQPVGPALVLSPATTPPTLASDPASGLIATFSFTGSSPTPTAAARPRSSPRPGRSHSVTAARCTSPTTRRATAGPSTPAKELSRAASTPASRCSPPDQARPRTSDRNGDRPIARDSAFRETGRFRVRRGGEGTAV